MEVEVEEEEFQVELEETEVPVLSKSPNTSYHKSAENTKIILIVK